MVILIGLLEAGRMDDSGPFVPTSSNFSDSARKIAKKGRGRPANEKKAEISRKSIGLDEDEDVDDDAVAEADQATNKPIKIKGWECAFPEEFQAGLRENVFGDHGEEKAPIFSKLAITRWSKLGPSGQFRCCLSSLSLLIPFCLAPMIGLMKLAVIMPSVIAALVEDTHFFHVPVKEIFDRHWLKSLAPTKSIASEAGKGKVVSVRPPVLTKLKYAALTADNAATFAKWVVDDGFLNHERSIPAFLVLGVNDLEHAFAAHLKDLLPTKTHEDDGNLTIDIKDKDEMQRSMAEAMQSRYDDGMLLVIAPQDDRVSSWLDDLGFAFHKRLGQLVVQHRRGTFFMEIDAYCYGKPSKYVFVGGAALGIKSSTWVTTASKVFLLILQTK